MKSPGLTQESGFILRESDDISGGVGKNGTKGKSLREKEEFDNKEPRKKGRPRGQNLSIDHKTKKG